MTDEQILHLALHPRTRDEGFRMLVVTYQERLYNHIRRQLPSHDDADDVLQNTFLKVFRHLHSFEGKSTLFTWLYRIAQNEIHNHHTRQKRHAVVELDSKLPHEAESYVNLEEVNVWVENAAASLPERQQMVFRMRYYDELSYKEIANILQLTEGALKASFHHAVKKIVEQLRAKQI